jgi:hypothetical protein
MDRVLDQLDDRFAFEVLPFAAVPPWEWLFLPVHHGWLPSPRQFPPLVLPLPWTDGNFEFSFFFIFDFF